MILLYLFLLATLILAWFDIRHGRVAHELIKDAKLENKALHSEIDSLHLRMRTNTSPEASQARAQAPADAMPITGVHGPLTDAMRERQWHMQIRQQMLAQSAQTGDQLIRIFSELDGLRERQMRSRMARPLPANPILANPRDPASWVGATRLPQNPASTEGTSHLPNNEDLIALGRAVDRYQEDKAKEEKDSSRFDLIELD